MTDNGGTMNPYTLQARLFESLQKHGSRIALEYGEKAVSYSQLEEKSTLVSDLIIKKGIKKETFIGVYIADIIDFIAALVGILKANCVFVPLDTALPAKRLEQMLQVTGTRVLISDTQGSRQWSDLGNGIEKHIETTLLVDCCDRENAATEGKPPIEKETGTGEYHPEDKIYIYFTSGTTGTPKAILGKNKSLRHFIDWECETFHIDCETRFSQLMAIGFDAFLRDVLTPLFMGGTVCIPPARDILTQGDELIHWIEKMRIHLLHSVPSLFRILSSALADPREPRENPPPVFRHLKYVLLSGEKINPRELENWYDIIGGRIQLVNLYGPTETTLVKTFYFINPEDARKGKIPIGKPMRGAQVILFDKDMKICARGTVGEIFIRTPYRTFGYFNDGEVNHRQFIPNPLTGDSNDLLYKTGDLGRELPGGDFEFLGRIDRQVKIRGARVEPGEIEGIIQGHPEVQEAVVIPVENQENESLLCAFYVSGRKLGESRLREFLFSHLPGNLVPPYIYRLDRIPLLPNGKIDGKELKSLAATRLGDTRYRAPRNIVEQKLSDIWSQLLKKEKIGIDDNFFHLGGQSLAMVRLAAEIKNTFEVEMTLVQLFNNPHIEGIAGYILSKQPGNILGENRDEALVIFNKTGPKKLFFFPPQVGYGIAYKELAELLPGYAVYSFNFIESWDRIQRYAKIIQEIQETGPYRFFGYSAGGNLAFDTALEMEKQGKEVSDVIMMDSFRRQVTFRLGTEEELIRFLDNLSQGMEQMGVGFLKEKVIENARAYTDYHQNTLTRGVVEANLHLIVSTDRQQRETQLEITGHWQEGVPLSTGWEMHTTKKYFVYHGAGRHVEMIAPGYLEKNAEIIGKILNESELTRQCPL